MSNKYTYSVPFTEEELYDSYVNKGMSQDEIAVAFGTSQHVVWRAMKKMGVPTRKAAARNQAGGANNNWRGGRVLMAQKPDRPTIGSGGYWYVYEPTHPNAKSAGYVAEHIKAATEAAGRPLAKGECVHHVDLDKHANTPDNLAITSRIEHARWHNQLEEIAVAFMRAGYIAFSSASGYILTQKGGDALCPNEE